MTRRTPDVAARRRAFDELCRALLEGEAVMVDVTDDEMALLREFMDEEELQALNDECRRRDEGEV